MQGVIMTHEDILKAAMQRYELGERDCPISAFVSGAEWMQKQMIEKACEWIQQVFYIEEDVEWFDDGQRRVFTTIKTSYDNNHELIDAFKRAMEE